MLSTDIYLGLHERRELDSPVLYILRKGRNKLPAIVSSLHVILTVLSNLADLRQGVSPMYICRGTCPEKGSHSGTFYILCEILCWFCFLHGECFTAKYESY